MTAGLIDPPAPFAAIADWEAYRQRLLDLPDGWDGRADLLREADETLAALRREDTT